MFQLLCYTVPNNKNYRVYTIILFFSFFRLFWLLCGLV